MTDHSSSPIDVSIDDDELGNVRLTKTGDDGLPLTSTTSRRRAPMWRNPWLFSITLIIGILLLNVAVVPMSTMSSSPPSESDSGAAGAGTSADEEEPLTHQVKVTQTKIEPSSSTSTTLGEFGHAVAMSADGSRMVVASVPPEGDAAAAAAVGLVHVFSYDDDDVTSWKYEQTLIAEDYSPLDDNKMESSGSNMTMMTVPMHMDDAIFHPVIDMSQDGERVVFSTLQNSVVVFMKHEAHSGAHKWRQLGSAMIPPNINHEHVVDVAMAANGLIVAIMWHHHPDNITTFEHTSFVRIYHHVHAPIIEDDWAYRAEIKLSSHSHGTLSFDNNGNLLAVGQHSEDGVPAIVSVYTVNKANSGEWLPFGDAMVDSQYTPQGSARPLSLGGIVHMSGDGSTLAVGGKDNVVTVLKWHQYSSPDQANAGIEWKPFGMGLDGVIRDESPYSTFGTSLQLNLNGTRLVVGAPVPPELWNETETTLAPELLPYTYGSIHLYILDPEIDEWLQVFNDNSDEEHPAGVETAVVRSENQLDLFGKSVCMNAEGDKVIVGAPQAGEFGTVTGIQIDPIGP